MQIDGKRGAGRPKQTWKKLTEKDCSEWKLTTVDPQERSTCRSGVRSAMRAASQLPGKGPLMWMMPLHLHVNQKSDYDYDDDEIKFIKINLSEIPPECQTVIAPIRPFNSDSSECVTENYFLISQSKHMLWIHKMRRFF